MIDNRLITPKEAAKILGLNVQTLRRYCRENKIRYVKFGNHIRIRPLALKDFIEKHEV